MGMGTPGKSARGDGKRVGGGHVAVFGKLHLVVVIIKQ